MTIEWLRSPVVCEGRMVRPALSPDAIGDNDLPDICLRMSMIMESIEWKWCEGRLMNVELFDSIDDLESKLCHDNGVLIADWRSTIDRFGRYYNLNGTKPIEVASKSITDYLHIADRHDLDLGNRARELGLSNSEAEFWFQVVRHGLPRFRFLCRPSTIAEIDQELPNVPEWHKLRKKIGPNDKIWPFCYPRRRRYWGKKNGYVVLRGAQFVGGIVTLSE